MINKKSLILEGLVLKLKQALQSQNTKEIKEQVLRVSDFLSEWENRLLTEKEPIYSELSSCGLEALELLHKKGELFSQAVVDTNLSDMQEDIGVWPAHIGYTDGELKGRNEYKNLVDCFNFNSVVDTFFNTVDGIKLYKRLTSDKNICNITSFLFNVLTSSMSEVAQKNTIDFISHMSQADCQKITNHLADADSLLRLSDSKKTSKDINQKLRFQLLAAASARANEFYKLYECIILSKDYEGDIKIEMDDLADIFTLLNKKGHITKKTQDFLNKNISLLTLEDIKITIPMYVQSFKYIYLKDSLASQALRESFRANNAECFSKIENILLDDLLSNYLSAEASENSSAQNLSSQASAHAKVLFDQIKNSSNLAKKYSISRFFQSYESFKEAVAWKKLSDAGILDKFLALSQEFDYLNPVLNSLFKKLSMQDLQGLLSYPELMQLDKPISQIIMSSQNNTMRQSHVSVYSGAQNNNSINIKDFFDRCRHKDLPFLALCALQEKDIFEAILQKTQVSEVSAKKILFNYPKELNKDKLGNIFHQTSEDLVLQTLNPQCLSGLVGLCKDLSIDEALDLVARGCSLFTAKTHLSNWSHSRKKEYDCDQFSHFVLAVYKSTKKQSQEALLRNINHQISSSINLNQKANVSHNLNLLQDTLTSVIEKEKINSSIKEINEQEKTSKLFKI